MSVSAMPSPLILARTWPMAAVLASWASRAVGPRDWTPAVTKAMSGAAWTMPSPTTVSPAEPAAGGDAGTGGTGWIWAGAAWAGADAWAGATGLAGWRPAGAGGTTPGALPAWPGAIAGWVTPAGG